MARELITSVPQFICIAVNEDDPRHPPEIINLNNVDYIQIFSPTELIIKFASGKTKILKGDRAQSLINQCFETKP